MNAKPFYLSKTFWINLIMATLLFLSAPELIQILPPTWFKYVATLTVACNLVLRFISQGQVVSTAEKAKAINDPNALPPQDGKGNPA